MLKIEIFGIGCENCARLEAKVRSAVERLGIKAEITKVEDFETLIRRGITATPGMAIDGRIVSLGRVPPVEEINEMLTQSAVESTAPPTFELKVINPTCGCATKGTMIYPCSGGANVGQISNEVAKSMVESGIGKFSCLAGLGSHSEGFIASAKKASQIVVLDGCGTKCVYKMLKHVGIEPAVHVIITELGIKKDYDQLRPSQDEVEKVLAAVKSKL